MDINDIKIETTDEKIVYPQDKGPMAKFNIALDEAIKGEDEFWTITRTLKQIVTFDNAIYFVREASVKALDRDFSRAESTTHKSLSALIAEYGGDFFSKEKWDGKQYALRNADFNKTAGIAGDAENL